VAVEFGAPTEQPSQGDLVRAAPSVHVESLDCLVRIDAKRYEVRDSAPPQTDLSRKHAAHATAIRGLSVLLTHDCEIDKNVRRATVMLALVRTLDGVPYDQRDGFRQNTRHRALYVGALDEMGGKESYVDLRIVTTVRRDAFELLERPASMNEDGRRMLREQVFRFFTRRFLPGDWTSWEEET
jgi:hypothetical protein